MQQISTNHALEFLDRIQKEFGKLYSEDNYNDFADRLSGHSRDVLDRSFAGVVRNCDRLPPFAKIIREVDFAVASSPYALKADSAKIEDKKERVGRLITRWSLEFQTSDILARARRCDVEWNIYQYARSMAETQAFLIEQCNAPGYYDFDNRARFDLEEFRRRNSWYLEICKMQADIGRIDVFVPEYVFEYYVGRLKK